VDVAGPGRYPNPDRAMLDLSDSAAFRFPGDPWSGLALRSEPNRLALEIDPLVERLRRADDTTLCVMTSAAATLTWHGRRLRGRVTHEYLVRRDGNLMTRRSFSGLGEMQYHDVRALVAFSGTVTDPDTHAEYCEPLLNGFEEKELPQRFAEQRPVTRGPAGVLSRWATGTGSARRTWSSPVRGGRPDRSGGATGLGLWPRSLGAGRP